MKITVSLDTQAVITQPSPLRFKGGCFTLVEIGFTRGSQIVPLPDGAVIEFSIKPKNQWTGGLLAYLNTFTPTSGNLYSGSLNCATAALMAALGLSDQVPANDVAQVDASAEVTWSFGGQKFRSTTFSATVETPITDDNAAATPDPQLYPLPGDIALKSNLASVATSGSYNDLQGLPAIPSAQVPSDWNATSGPAQILNKPQLGSAAAHDAADFAPVQQIYEIKTAAFTAVAGKAYVVDTSSGSFNVTIDPALPVGDYIDFADAKGVWSTNPPTFLHGGFLMEGITSNYTDRTQGGFLRFINVGGPIGLRILEAGALPQSDGAITLGTNTAIGTTANVANLGHWFGYPSSIAYQWRYVVTNYNGDFSNDEPSVDLGTDSTQFLDWNLWRDPNNTFYNGMLMAWVTIFCDIIGQNYVGAATVTKSFGLGMPVYPSTLAYYPVSSPSDAKGNFPDLTSSGSAILGSSYDEWGPMHNFASFPDATATFTTPSQAMENVCGISAFVQKTAGATVPCPGIVVNDSGNGSNFTFIIDPSSYISDSNQHHVALAFHDIYMNWDCYSDGRVVDLFVDGVLKASYFIGQGWWRSNPVYSLSLNATGGVGHVAGVVVLDHAPTAAEADWLYNGGSGRFPS